MRFRVEGVVGSLSDASATLSCLYLTWALIISAGSKAEPGQQPDARRAASGSLPVTGREGYLLSTTSLSVARGITIMTHYTATSMFRRADAHDGNGQQRVERDEDHRHLSPRATRDAGGSSAYKREGAELAVVQ